MQPLLTVEQAAELLNVSSWTIRRWIKRGSLPHVKLGNLVRVESEDVQQFKDSRKA